MEVLRGNKVLGFFLFCVQALTGSTARESQDISQRDALCMHVGGLLCMSSFQRQSSSRKQHTQHQRHREEGENGEKKRKNQPSLAQSLRSLFAEACRTDNRQSRGQKWPDIHKKARDERKEAPSLSWTEAKGLRGVPRVSRILDAINISYLRYHLSELHAGHPNTSASHFLPCPWYLDVTQCISRRAHASRVRGMCSSSMFYSYAKQRVLLRQKWTG